MQQSMLQQAEAIWQAQHDRLATELAQAQHSSQSALAKAQDRHSGDLQALQVSHFG